MGRVHKTYLLYTFYWTSNYDEDGYNFAFNIMTGQISEDHGLLDGDEKDFRYANVHGISMLADEEFSMAGMDIFSNDLEKISSVLKHSIQKDGRNVFEVFGPPPAFGETTFVYKFCGGQDEATPNGPGEYWSEMEYMGELNALLSGVDSDN
jgi:hypothetical protein